MFLQLARFCNIGLELDILMIWLLFSRFMAVEYVSLLHTEAKGLMETFSSIFFIYFFQPFYGFLVAKLLGYIKWNKDFIYLNNKKKLKFLNDF